MPDSRIFCNAPWYELQIYWDGSLGFCCQESHKMYPESEAAQYNIKNMTIKQWFDSEPMRRARLSMFGSDKNSFCTRCYLEEHHRGTSRRHRSNQKSVIFTKSAFEHSYLQSPGHNKFYRSQQQQGCYDGMPIDLHIDLGNYCNLACKMCHPQASSVIASQHVKWGMQDAVKFIGTDWTRDESVWNRVLNELAEIPLLKNIHFMGGETLITRRFEDFVDFMIDRRRTDICFSFVTNGTVFNERLLEKLKKFQRVGIEVSIESMDGTNAYQRQGTDQTQVETNIQKYLGHCNGSSITLTARPAISALTIGSFPGLLEFCWNHRLIVKSLLVSKPLYLDATILPENVRDLYIGRYQGLAARLGLESMEPNIDFNESDPNQLPLIIQNQIQQCISVLTAPRPPDCDQRLADMVIWCRRWDDIYGMDALNIYPELREVFLHHGY